MHILIAGGTGSIGRRLIEHLFKYKHVITVVSRQPFKPASLPAKIQFARWDGKTAEGWGHLIEEVDAVVNLAGAGLADERWTDERKKVILASRLDPGAAIVEAIGAANNKPKVLIQASAVGYYGTKRDGALTESAPPGDDFLAEVCKQWEDSTKAVEEMGVRRVITRTGIVLDLEGLVLPKMLIPFRLFAGGPIGSGRQWISWIHYCDEVEAIRYLIEEAAISGPVDLTAPYPLRQHDFARVIGEVLGRPAFVPAPDFVFKLLFGEMSMILLEGQQILPARLDAAGFCFKFPRAEDALRNLL